MKVIYKDDEIWSIITNHSMTVEEALYSLGVDVDNQDDCRQAYESGAEYAYLDDYGNYCIDIENIELEWEW